MTITITAEDFNDFAKYTRPERLEKFLLKHYKDMNSDIETEIIGCQYVTKEMVCKLFAAHFPRYDSTFRALLLKCTADDLLSYLINNAAVTGLCWYTPVPKENPKDSVMSMVLSCCISYNQYILEEFINADIVAAGNIQLELRSQLANNHISRASDIIKIAQEKYKLAEILDGILLEDIQKLAHYNQHNRLHSKLQEVIDARNAAATKATCGATETDYYSPDEDGGVPVAGAAHDEAD